MKFLKRASFWKTIIQAFQVGLSTLQGVTLYSEELVRDFNIWIAVIQGLLAMVAILTQDANHNDVIDIIESQSQVDVTVTAPPNVDVTVNKETTPPK
jgi:hypothetical protein